MYRKTAPQHSVALLCIYWFKSGEQVVVTGKVMCERVYPCRGITHSTGGEMSNLIFRGEDLLLGDHGQPNQTLGGG